MKRRVAATGAMSLAALAAVAASGALQGGVPNVYDLLLPAPQRLEVCGGDDVASSGLLAECDIRLGAVTGMTFCPIEGTSEHPREVSDLEYSATPPLHAFVRPSGNDLVRERVVGAASR